VLAHSLPLNGGAGLCHDLAHHLFNDAARPFLRDVSGACLVLDALNFRADALRFPLAAGECGFGPPLAVAVGVVAKPVWAGRSLVNGSHKCYNNSLQRSRLSSPSKTGCFRPLLRDAARKLATWVRFPSPAPISLSTNKINGLVNFSSLKKGVLLTQTANASKFVIPVHGCLNLFCESQNEPNVNRLAISGH
jgi:hypothetical protein